jgi:hypothetical protein
MTPSLNVSPEGAESSPGTTSPPEPWIETREGMRFFANALLIAPEFMVFFPLLLAALVAPVGAPDSLLEILGVMPTLARFALPFVGWFFVVPLWFALKVRRECQRPVARRFLGVFAALHACFVAYPIWFWASGASFPAT